MDFRYTPEEEAFRTKLHSWLEKTRAEVFGRGGELGASTASLLDVGDDARWMRLLEYHRRLYEAGYVALHWPNFNTHGDQGAEGPLSAQDAYRRGDLVPRLFGAERRLRPRRVTNPSSFGWR